MRCVAALAARPSRYARGCHEARHTLLGSLAQSQCQARAPARSLRETPPHRCRKRAAAFWQTHANICVILVLLSWASYLRSFARAPASFFFLCRVLIDAERATLGLKGCTLLRASQEGELWWQWVWVGESRVRCSCQAVAPRQAPIAAAPVRCRPLLGMSAVRDRGSC